MNWVSNDALSACIVPMRFHPFAGTNILGLRTFDISMPKYCLNFFLSRASYPVNFTNQGHG